MEKLEENVLELAKTYTNNSEESIEKLFQNTVNENTVGGDKAKTFFRIGIILFNHSYFALADKVWCVALDYFKYQNDRKGEAGCYANIGAVYGYFGKYQKAIDNQNL